MPQRLVLVVLCAIPLVAIACSGQTGLTALGSVSVRGTTTGGPFEGTFDFPSETRLDGSAGLSAMCTIARSTGTGGTPIYSAVVDLIVPISAGNPLETVTLMARSDATTGTIEADVRGAHFSNTACAYTTSYVGGDGSLHIRTTGDCTLTGDAGATVVASTNLIVRGCTVLVE